MKKLDLALALLGQLDRRPQSQPELAAQLGVSVPTIARTVAELRKVGCRIESVRDGSSWGYSLQDWGVFDAQRVRDFLAE
jgi:biotin operon repressor